MRRVQWTCKGSIKAATLQSAANDSQGGSRRLSVYMRVHIYIYIYMYIYIYIYVFIYLFIDLYILYMFPGPLRRSLAVGRPVAVAAVRDSAGPRRSAPGHGGAPRWCERERFLYLMIKPPSRQLFASVANVGIRAPRACRARSSGSGQSRKLPARPEALFVRASALDLHSPRAKVV